MTLESFGLPLMHEHEWRPLRSVRAPVGPPPGHTQFEVLICNCGTFDVFPRSNFLLISSEWRQLFVGQMATLGMRWVGDLP